MSTVVKTASDHRKSLLREMLHEEATTQGQAARRWDTGVELVFYSAIMSGVIAVLVGLASGSSIVREAIGLAAAFGISTVLLMQEARCRQRAEQCRAAQDLAQEMIHRLDYEMWEPITAETLAAVSAEWRSRRNRLRLQARTAASGKATSSIVLRMLNPLKG